MNSPTLYGQFSCDRFYMADRMGLHGTMLHYLAVWKAIVNVHRPVYSKITLTYSLTWQTDRCSPWRMGFKLLFPRLFFLCAYCSKNCQNRLLLKHSYVYCRLSINYVSGQIDDPSTLN